MTWNRGCDMRSIRIPLAVAVVLASVFLVNAAEARFLSVDPAASGKTGSSQSWNRYTFVLNNPVKLVDPNGEEARLGQQPDRGLAAARLTVPANVRHSINAGTNDAGQPILTVDNSIKSDSLNYNNLRKVINSPGVVEINVGNDFLYQASDGTTQSTSLSDVPLKGFTLPTQATGGEAEVFSTTPGVTEVYVQEGLSDSQLAPVVAAEIAGHALPGLLGEGAAVAEEHENREIPAIEEARQNRVQ